MNDEKYKCPHCGKLYGKNGIGSHIWRKHTDDGLKFNPVQNRKYGDPWNKGLSKEINDSVLKGSMKIKGRESTFKGKKHKDESKNKISNVMKTRHKEGLAHNIGESRWNNEPSWPEQFFMSVIENEFLNKDYIREMSFGKFSLDFAWIDLKRCIEIDGDQHERFEDQKRRDKEKDQLLNDNGWSILRIKWKDMFNDTKTWIKISKEFIEK